MKAACGKAGISTHKRYPLPCSGSCRSLPVEARSAVEGAQSFPPPGNPVGIPPPPTAAATANQVKNQITEEAASNAFVIRDCVSYSKAAGLFAPLRDAQEALSQPRFGYHPAPMSARRRWATGSPGESTREPSPS
jgi:LmbE family N-acetylglucosaminyl deacetylase